MARPTSSASDRRRHVRPGGQADGQTPRRCRFGGSVAIDGDTIVIGATPRRRIQRARPTPSATPATGWRARGRTPISDAAADDPLAASVAIDGNTIVTVGSAWTVATTTTPAEHNALRLGARPNPTTRRRSTRGGQVGSAPTPRGRRRLAGGDDGRESRRWGRAATQPRMTGRLVILTSSPTAQTPLQSLAGRRHAPGRAGGERGAFRPLVATVKRPAVQARLRGPRCRPPATALARVGARSRAPSTPRSDARKREAGGKRPPGGAQAETPHTPRVVRQRLLVSYRPLASRGLVGSASARPRARARLVLARLERDSKVLRAACPAPASGGASRAPQAD